MEVFSGRKRPVLKAKKKITEIQNPSPHSQAWSGWFIVLVSLFAVWFRFFPPLSFVHVMFVPEKNISANFIYKLCGANVHFKKNDGLFFYWQRLRGRNF